MHQINQRKVAASNAFACASCSFVNDSMTAEWCSCVSLKPTLSCAACGRCFCAASAAWRLSFFASDAASAFRIRSAELAKAAPPVLPAGGEMARPLILIVDDDRVTHLIVARVLAGVGGTLVHAEDGQTALRLATTLRPDLVITDALLPKLDGRELGRILKTTPETSHCKVIVMTALYKGLRYRAEALKTFLIDEYVEKPLKPEVLRSLVGSLLARAELSAGPAMPPERLELAAAS